MPGRKVAVLQSNYIPWKGYFDIINDVDLFVFYDDLQYTKNDWRNRNKIKTDKGLEWITIPAGNNLDRLICEVEIGDKRWQRKHWQQISQHYGKCDFFAHYRNLFEDFYLGEKRRNLSQLNQHLIRVIATEVLQVTTRFADSRDYAVTATRSERLLNLVRSTEADTYVSGPSARSYIDDQSFAAANIELVWKDYSGYPEYPQRYPPFEHGVSILDLIFNVGPEAPWYIWGWRNQPDQHS